MSVRKQASLNKKYKNDSGVDGIMHVVVHVYVDITVSTFPPPVTQEYYMHVYY